MSEHRDEILQAFQLELRQLQKTVSDGRLTGVRWHDFC